ncbi:hypothetical protein MED01_002459 [Micromonospora sp. MED01]|uniref:hypothetical protein n=1 Tax=Micromonospora alfalfae TaxID=2911212 RepID=UPI001EE8E3C6|nr:hypothetical protein [Micromonospora alfalfae]MCG5464293.1 hypothetical protein [Micromonospora alfalfae]
MSPAMPAGDPDRSGWVGFRAVAWVLEEAPVPADLAWMLTVIARRCDEHGKGSWQTTKTMASVAGKSVKQAQREVVQLRKLGLIVPGNQSLVAHLPAGKRPTVYDVPLHLKGPKPLKESRNKSGLRKEVETVTPPMDGSPPLQGTPPIEGEPTPPLDGESTPPLQGRQKKPLNNPLNNPSSLSARTSVPAPREPDTEDRERDESTSSEDPNLTEQQRIVIHDGNCPEHLAQLVVEFTEIKHTVRNIAWWRRVKKHGDAPRIVQEALNALPDNIDGPGELTQDPTPCPMHPSSRARNCGSCWGDVKAGQDPYKYRPELRPPWFWEVYNRQHRQSAEAEKAAGWLALPGRSRQLHNSHDNPDRYDVKL